MEDTLVSLYTGFRVAERAAEWQKSKTRAMMLIKNTHLGNSLLHPWNHMFLTVYFPLSAYSFLRQRRTSHGLRRRSNTFTYHHIVVLLGSDPEE